MPCIEGSPFEKQHPSRQSRHLSVIPASQADGCLRRSSNGARDKMVVNLLFPSLSKGGTSVVAIPDPQELTGERIYALVSAKEVSITCAAAVANTTVADTAAFRRHRESPRNIYS